MGIDVSNNQEAFNELCDHAHHEIEIVTYGAYGREAMNVSIECVTCNVALLDFNNPELEAEPEVEGVETIHKYRVEVDYRVSEYVDIEAKDAEEAEYIAGDVDLHLSEEQDYIGDYESYIVEIDGEKVLEF